MARTQRLSRRLFLTELGRSSFAVAILGTGIAACSSTSPNGDASAPGGDDGAPSSSTATANPPTSSRAAEDGGAPEGNELQWERVNFDVVSAYVLVRGNEVALVDTGTAGNESRIAAALGVLGKGWGDVDHVIVTHAHDDHFGGLAAVMTAAPTAAGYAGSADIARLTAPRDLMALTGGDEVFGLQILSTPGHTPGHISAFDPGTGLLLAGDALNSQDGLLAGPAEQFSADIAVANESVKNLVGTPVEAVLVGHGDPITDNAAEQLAALAGQL